MKKGNVLLVLLILAGLVAVAWVIGIFGRSGKYDDPKKWNASYRHTDAMPFGMELFDSVMATSLPNGYRYGKMPVDEACRADSTGRVSLAYIYSSAYFSDEEEKQLLAFAARGNNLLLVANNYPEDTYDEESNTSLAKSLGFSSIRFGDFDFSEFKDSLQDAAKDSITWTHGDGQVFHMTPQLLSAGLVNKDIRNQKMATVEAIFEDMDDYSSGKISVPVLLQRNYGKGKIVIATNTLLFTNYGVLHPEISAYVGRVMALVADKPMVRFSDTYSMRQGEMDGQSPSPLSFLLKNKPTRWALFMALAAIVLFFIFRARRRQRVIPVMPLPENKSVEFARVLGTIYYRRGDHRDLLNKKYLHFAYEVRRRLFVDVTDPAADQHTVAALANVSGIPASDLQMQLRVIREALKPSDRQLDKEQLQQYIDFMNKVLSSLVVRRE
ncbi:MAG: hypothetical protein IKX22_09045 [Prevotella sp.]|nr:hypothetical protein [Prevotella sp.]